MQRDVCKDLPCLWPYWSRIYSYHQYAYSQDYFADLQAWLPGYFFAHVVGTCFECLINLFTVSILRGKSLFGDVEQVAHKMKQDKQVGS